jgi:hypothetical protein
MAISIKKGTTVKSEKGRIKIISVSKNERREIWTFGKDQRFIPSLLEFLKDLGFTMEDFDINYYFGYSMEGDESMPENLFDDPFSGEYLSVDLFSNELYTFNKKDKDIEVIFFVDKIILILRTDLSSAKMGEKYGLF